MVDELTRKIRESVLNEGFAAVGIVKAEELLEESRYYKSWINNGYAAGMSYLYRNLEKRCNPSKLLPGAKSVVVAILPYNIGICRQCKFKISKYAYVPDYHYIVKSRLRRVLLQFPDLRMPAQQVFCDSAPLLERSLAFRAGLGRYGKNSTLINDEIGSFFFIGEMLLPVELSYDTPLHGSPCIGCNKCLKACPSGALSVNHHGVDARKCLSYLTIECKDDIENYPIVKNTSTLFGCDICQDVCPWNIQVSRNSDQPFESYVYWSDGDWRNLDECIFEEELKGSSLARAGYLKLKRCVEFISD